MKTTFLVVYQPGPAWTEGALVTEPPLREHGKYLLGLFVKGNMKFAGPFTNNAGGAVVLEAADEPEAVAIVTDDPAVNAGFFVYEVHQWTMVPWEKYLK
jgi:uncharacterized protein